MYFRKGGEKENFVPVKQLPESSHPDLQHPNTKSFPYPKQEEQHSPQSKSQ
jgi:hypothetical protein